ncbi:hypothetical protein D0Z07_4239 [Hyphodiscus hymeniophilus]|uniref:Uncharacterized protein n=1 Tax=Hyphodiscus hymeniophilus TaxID=353542 RepID=A0A9P6VJW7_9HELO|nr:hypothetical protein D0Z07_4239 [Hyphodiscus hymeniophilus]
MVISPEEGKTEYHPLFDDVFEGLKNTLSSKMPLPSFATHAVPYHAGDEHSHQLWARAKQSVMENSHSINDETTQEVASTEDQSLVREVTPDRGREEPLSANREQQPGIYTANASLRASFASSPQLPGAISGNNVLSLDGQRVSKGYLRDPCETFYGWPTPITSDDQYNVSLGRTFDPPNGQDSLGTFTFSDFQSTATNWSQDFNPNTSLQGPREDNGAVPPHGQNGWQLSIDTLLQASLQQPRPSSSVANAEIADDNIDFSPGSDYMNSQRSNVLLNYFGKITQPPASILITGVRKWRRLQSYFTKLSRHHRVVASALFAIIELLAKDDQSASRADMIDSLTSMGPALKLHEAARGEIEVMMSKEWQNCTARNALLASIFLLAWFEVVRDQVYDQKLFPCELAEQIITSSGSWNRYSRQLLQWFNTLDSKASHLGGQHLLSQRTLHVVSEHHTQINADDSSDEHQSDDERTNDSVFSPNEQNHNQKPSPNTTAAATLSSQDDTATSPFVSNDGFKSLRQMKTVLLNTILQPALDWYQSTQKYCRHISSHDRYHRSRGTVKDEYEVVIACKQLELELIHLWRQRPQIIRLSISQLREIVCADVAGRLEAIFNLYMASFWILFVYLHRVVWWHLPLSEIAARALEETWQNLQRSFGEVVEGEKKVVHPALLWPLFMFGSECGDEARRRWAIEQLLALGEASTVVRDEDEESGGTVARISKEAE